MRYTTFLILLITLGSSPAVALSASTGAKTITRAPPATTVPPVDYWTSQRFAIPFRSVAVGTVRMKGVSDIVAMGYDRIMLLEREGGKLASVAEFTAPRRDEEFLRIYAHDVDGDGLDEILVNTFRSGKLQAFILKLQDGKWSVIADNIKYLVAVRRYEGKPTILGQKKYYTDKLQGPLFKLTYASGKISGERLGKMPFNLDLFGTEFVQLPGAEGEQLVTLRSSGYVELYEAKRGKWSRRWSSGERFAQATEYVDKPQRTVYNEVIDVHWYLQPDISVMQGAVPQLVVPRNSDYLKGIVGNEPSIKWSELHRFEWTDLGFRQVWQGERLDGKISDFKLADVTGDGKVDIVTALQLRDGGYFRGLTPQKDSVILIYTP